MPNWFPSYTECRDSGGYYPVPIGALSLVGATGIGALVAAGISGAWAPGVAALLALVCLAGIAFCTWWLNVRLICLGGDRSAVGAIYSTDTTSSTLDAFALGDYDTDYTFDLLLWPFVTQDELPGAFVEDQWSADAMAQLQADWPTVFPVGVPDIALPEVQSQVSLILAQQSMASLKLGFSGRGVEPDDEPKPAPAGGSSQHFLLHCEIEGAGIYELRILLWALFGVFVAAAALSAIPVVGSALSWILSILAFLAFLLGGAAIQHDHASPPVGGGWGGAFNVYTKAGSPDSLVDLAYVYGRWVYDSLHSGWNELHPLYFMIKLGQTTRGALTAGDWGLPDVRTAKSKLDAYFAEIDAPNAAVIQAEPQNRWTLHPVLDGCIRGIGYPSPSPKPPLQ